MDYIDKAFTKVKRAGFVLPERTSVADYDIPLPIGFGQTISQPTTVRLMLEWLEPEPGNKILDVGSGSGWTTALLADIVGPKGMVYAVELIPELIEFGRDNCQRLGIKNVRFYEAGTDYGLPRYAPYDRILVSASGERIPESLVDQLKIGGKLVIPIRNHILEIEKLADGQVQTDVHPGFVFVPLVDKSKT
ncbi:protein-L-isoaspartate carboxylmethyltransferase [Candidatus Saccharibacteria bacterium CG10_big_fil_rev_8_21_14_0_10_47_8]|nr:MAG: protein-L-isoaspartate carboxylmethyltransferase [Candidatus Saccharibacteria bacterium CG10_big_fil_rev_8_21_14_0_10_47_8]